MRSIRNKLEYIRDQFCDFECLSLTETHLDNNIENAELFLTHDFAIPYRKDRTNHGGGILVYINNNLIHHRRQDLEVFWEECGWDSLSKRRYFQKMCFMYKCSNNLVPDYISDIIPPLDGEVSNYPLRNRQNIASMYTRTEISRKCCIPPAVSDWNNLNNNMREIDTYVSFRSTFKNDVLGTTHVPSYFLKGIILTII